MYLLNVHTGKLEEVFESKARPYAILSHRWGKGEVTFRDINMSTGGYKKKHGYQKIRHARKQARDDGLNFVWVDSCCIDRRNSAELSESINSMFRWYRNAAVCYAYLEDVSKSGNASEWKSALKNSLWFTRGWTLQELLAPRELVLFGEGWSRLDTRANLAEEISKITGIDKRFLDTGKNMLPPDLGQASIAQRMSWASSRKTTRKEDEAYCLLGIFGVNMPLIYGEGERAFIRLQQEIIKHSDDQTLFAWSYPKGVQGQQGHGISRFPSSSNFEGLGILAPSPACFSSCKSIIPYKVNQRRSKFSVTNKGLQVRLPLSQHIHPYILLQCQSDSPTTLLAIPVRQVREDVYQRRPGNIIPLHYRTWDMWPKQKVFLAIDPQTDRPPKHGVLLGAIPPSFTIHSSSTQRYTPVPTEYRLTGLGPDEDVDRRTLTAVFILSSEAENYRLALRFEARTLQKPGTMVDDVVMTRSSLEKLPNDATINTYLESSRKRQTSGAEYISVEGNIIYASFTSQKPEGRLLYVADIYVSQSQWIFKWCYVRSTIITPTREFLSVLKSKRTLVGYIQQRILLITVPSFVLAYVLSSFSACRLDACLRHQCRICDFLITMVSESVVSAIAWIFETRGNTDQRRLYSYFQLYSTSIAILCFIFRIPWDNLWAIPIYVMLIFGPPIMGGILLLRRQVDYREGLYTNLQDPSPSWDQASAIDREL
ncbi:heterokaryon incompatibility protein-domain-containing protein [Aspergillus avenaceus]|uniref:Heterokaryon incompatibility protein-domain-containing protein n=1 Tax=Aspergillus avenaceus TaxID=36643 RepID=A0A5N6U845_ASPAV|nr:heterokaryon incompatibility protein-domain-containing protein [Aspergillus avenaceus]